MTEELKPSATPIQATLVPVKVWIEKDMMGTVHIKRQNEGGPAFDFIQIQYSHMHTCNAFQHGLAEQIVALLNGAALTAAQPAQAGERDTGPHVLREVFELCDDTMTKMESESTEFSRGRAFEAKGISRAIGTWFQDEFCGRSHMGEPVTQPAAQATPGLRTRLTADPTDPAVQARLAEKFGDVQATPEPVGEPRDREADRERFTDPNFNRWLDEAITENGEHTVWSALKSTGDAYAAWRAHPDYTHAAQPVPVNRDDLKALMSESGYVHVTAQEKADFINGFRNAEVHHSITSQGAQEGV